MSQSARTKPVATQGLTRHFGQVQAAQDITFEVEPGTILGVIGPSGSGKTTLLRMLTGTLAPTSGWVRVLDEDPLHFRPQTRERIGYMPQSFVLYPDLTARENIDFVAALFGLLWRRRYRRTREVLRLVDLWEARGRRAKDLSGGMQRRLTLACALVHDPRLCFFDEPTAGIDPVLRLSIWEEFRRLRDDGRTLVVTTQYVTESEFCDKVAVIAEGRLVAYAPPEQLRQEAYGGEPIVIETELAVEKAELGELTFLRSLEPEGGLTGPQHRFQAVTDDASQASPRIIEALQQRGIGVKAIHEATPTFDEVFARLIEDRTNGSGDDFNGASPRGDALRTDPTSGRAVEPGDRAS